jgi:hypothetical protein
MQPKPYDTFQICHAIRGRVISVVDWCAQHGFNKPYFYMVLSGRRGRTGRESEAKRMIEALRVEGLLPQANEAAQAQCTK